MKSISTNPFLITGYQGPDYFCDREKEQLLNVSIKEWQKYYINQSAPYGKDRTIKNVFYYIQKENKSAACFYLDIFSNPESSGVCISTGTKCVGEIRYLITEYLKIAILIL
mgnify:CR=1 FL=1